MTPWQNERWATTPANDGRNYAPAHRWAVVAARPLCFGQRKWDLYVQGRPCSECGAPGTDYSIYLGCPRSMERLRNWASPEASTAALLRVYIREAHELRDENDKLRGTVLELEADLAFEAEGNAYADAYVAECRDRIATLEAENAALRQNQPRCPDCGHRLDTEECGCGGDA